MLESNPIPKDIDQEIRAIFTEAQHETELLHQEHAKKLKEIELRVAERIKALGGVPVENSVETTPDVAGKLNARKEERKQSGKHRSSAAALVVPAISAGMGLYMVKNWWRPPWRKKSKITDEERTDGDRPIWTPAGNSEDEREQPVANETTTVHKYEDEPTVADEQQDGKRRRGAVIAAGLGGVAIGALGMWWAMKYGFDLGVPDWARGNPDLYKELTEQEGFEPGTVYDIYQDPDLYHELREDEVSVRVIENIYEDPSLYADLSQYDVEQADLYEFFGNEELYEELQDANLSSEEISAIIEHPNGYDQLTSAGLSPEVASEVLLYPELVDRLDANGVDDPVIRRIINNPELFHGLAEMEASYDVVEDVMTHPEQFSESLEQIGNPEFSLGDIDANGSEGNGSPVPPGERTDGRETIEFTVEKGHGYTHELQDFVADEYGRSLNGHDSYQLHQALLDEFGQNYLQGIPKYQMGGEYSGQVGLAHEGQAWWAPGVIEHIEELLKQQR